MFGVWIRWFWVVLALFAGASAVLAEPEGSQNVEFAEENAALIAATAEFFDDVEASTPPKRRKPVLGLTLEAIHSKISQPSAATLTQMGPVRHLTGYDITWYPLDRLRGTVDFMGTWGGNRNLVCGYLTWDLTDPETPELISVSANFLTLDDLTNAPDVKVHRSLMEANCAFGELDTNYAFFDVTG